MRGKEKRAGRNRVGIRSAVQQRFYDSRNMKTRPAESKNVSQRLAPFAFDGAFAFFSEGIAASAFGFAAGFGVCAAAVETFFATTDAKVAGEPFSRAAAPRS